MIFIKIVLCRMKPDRLLLFHHIIFFTDTQQKSALYHGDILHGFLMMRRILAFRFCFQPHGQQFKLAGLLKRDHLFKLIFLFTFSTDRELVTLHHQNIVALHI